MNEIQLDLGLQEYRLGEGVLRFNPADPALYHRFLQAAEELENLEQEINVQAEETADGAGVLALLDKADRKAKDALDRVFGPGTDFDALLGGVNLLAGTANGHRVIENLLEALMPILQNGAKEFYDREAEKELAQADAQRAARTK